MSEGCVTFYMAPDVPTDDPLENKLLRSHEAEANKQGAEFQNYGAFSGERDLLQDVTRTLRVSDQLKHNAG